MRCSAIIVLGEVRTPGFFQIETSMTVLEAVSRAGGFTLDGKKKSVLLIRGGLKTPQLITLNLEKALSKGDLAQNIQLQRDDIVYVPRTYISNVDRFFGHLATIISPLYTLESGFYTGQGIEGER
ncbi:MAG: SLBB domain-containing protein [Nitrospirae bacterium]|nr:SLBB domain-containing protein [Nitrospirota bacterium]